MLLMLTELLSGLALFLFGMKFMGENLQQMAGQKMRGFLEKCTKNKLIAVLFGTAFTAFIQSSGATTVMEVAFVNAGILSLEKSVGITFGANIGTTITAQLVSLKLTAVAPFIIFIGAVLIMFGSKPFIRRIADIIFGFGALFLGINYMTGALETLPEYPALVKLFSYLDTPIPSFPIVAMIVGLAFTLIVQSSSVTVSVLVLLAGTGLISPMSGMFYILGANIGSCAPAVFASMNASRNAKRTALIHVLFNVIGMIVIATILVLAGEHVQKFIESFSQGSYKRFVANADTVFKIFQTLLLLPFSSALVSLSKKIIRKKPGDEEDDDEMTLKYIGSTVGLAGKGFSTTAIFTAIKEISRMGEMVRLNLDEAIDSFLSGDVSNAETIRKREKYIDFLSHKITEFMVSASQYDIPISDSEKIGKLFHVVIDLERIGDHAINFVEDAEKGIDGQVAFSPEGYNELREMSDRVREIFDLSLKAFNENDKSNLERISSIEEFVDNMEISAQDGHVKRMAEGICSIEAGVVFTDVVIGLERIADHSTNIAFSILPAKG